MRQRRKRDGERGFAMLLVFLMAAAIAISLYMQMPRVAFESQRQKEQSLVDRGEAYKRAIQLFVRKNKRWPASLEDLEKSTNGRFLRQRYKDPMTGQDEWRLVHIANGVLTDSVNTKKDKDKDKKGSESNFIVAQNFIAPTQNGPEGAKTWDRRRPSEQAGAAGSATNPAPGGNNSPGQRSPDGSPLPAYNGPGPLIFPTTTGGQGAGATTPGTNNGQTPVPVPGAPGQAGVISGMPQQPNGTGQTNQVIPGVPIGITGNGVVNPNNGQAPPSNSQQQQSSGSSFIGGGSSFIGGGSGSGTSPTGVPLPGGRGNPSPGGASPTGINPMGMGQQGNMGSGTSSGFGSSSGNANNDALKAIQNQLMNPQANGGVVAGGMIGGSGIVGVASKLEAQGIMLREEHSKYNEWEFIYDPAKEKIPGQQQAGAGINANNNRNGGTNGTGLTNGGTNNSPTGGGGLFGGSSSSGSNNSSNSFIGGGSSSSNTPTPQPVPPPTRTNP